MFPHRRKRIETNKTNYYNNLVHYHLSPHQGIIPEFQEEVLWRSDKPENNPPENHNYNIYNTNIGGVAIGKDTAPLVALDISGSANVSQKYMINYVSIAPPIGSVMAYTMSTSPDGWLICNGANINRGTYAGLFAVIGTTFGSGDGINTFTLPNYQGAFLRGTGTNGVYSGPALNTSQTHATQTHSHTASSVVTDPGHTHTLTTFNDDYNFTGGSQAPSFNRNDAGSTTFSIINNNSTGITVATTVDNSTTNVNANETRPYNYGVYWIIKY